MAMQVQMRNKMMAQQLGMAREAFNWYAGFYGFAAVGLLAGFMRSRKPWMLGPLVPLTFLVGYQADMALGDKMDRILSKSI